MAKGRELKGRIKSVENTKKITRTMEMVATSKMKRAQDRVAAARPYAEALRDVIANLYTPELAEKFPLLRQPAQVKRVAEIVNELMGKFAKKEIDAVHIIFPNFKSVLSAPPATVQILPVTPPESKGK